MSLTPEHSIPVAGPARHARGVFRQPYSLNGLIVFHVYRCDGELMEVASVHPDWNPDLRGVELEASLDRRCPVHDQGAHRVICASIRDRLRLL